MSLSELYHVGIVVASFDDARAHFADLLDIVWGPAVEADVELRDGEGRDLTVQLRMCYSTQPPYLELIEERPGTPWVCNPHSNLHHIGYFADDLRGDSDSLASSQCPLEVAGRDGATVPTTFAYHRDLLGIRVELVDAAGRDMMESFMFKPPG